MASQWEFIKWIPGTRLMVDGFRFQNTICKSYLLTHFHSDHTTGLTKGFTSGLIFCTPITARLLRKDMGMPPERICELEMDKPKLIEGTEVTPIDANHCPGACMFLLKTKGGPSRRGQTILHTGDLRWSRKMAEHAALRNQRIDLLFLDTTYAKPSHTHPPQDICIDTMVKIMKEEIATNPRTLFVCGSYHIGKERAYLGAAKLLGWKVWCDANKRRVLKMLDLPDELMLLLCTKPKEARIHVDFLGGLQPERLQQRINPAASWTHVVAFRPTGWTYRRSGKQDVRQEGNVKIYGVPYSEHSSFPELRDCVATLRPLKLIPTVNATNHTAAENIISRFADLMDLSQDRSRLDFFMQKRQRLEAADDACTDTPYIKAEAVHEDQPSCGYDWPDESCRPSSEPPFCKIEDSAEAAAGGRPSFLEMPCKEEAQQDCQASRGSEFLRFGSCEGDPPPEVAIKAEEWSGQEAFQEQPVTAAKAEAEISCSPFSNGTPPEQAASEREPETNDLPTAGPCSQFLEEHSDRDEGKHWGTMEIRPASGQLPAGGSLHIPGFSRRVRQHSGNPTIGNPMRASSDQSDPEPSAAFLEAQESSKDTARLSEAGQEAACRLSTPQSRVHSLRQEAADGPWRADSDKSSTEHVDFDVASIDVSEQERILQSIVSDRQRMHTEIAKSLLKTRQPSMAAFLRKDKLLD